MVPTPSSGKAGVRARLSGIRPVSGMPRKRLYMALCGALVPFGCRGYVFVLFGLLWGFGAVWLSGLRIRPVRASMGLPRGSPVGEGRGCVQAVVGG